MQAVGYPTTRPQTPLRNTETVVLIIVYFNSLQKTFNAKYCYNNEFWSGMQNNLRWFSDSYFLPGSEDIA